MRGGRARRNSGDMPGKRRRTSSLSSIREDIIMQALRRHLLAVVSVLITFAFAGCSPQATDVPSPTALPPTHTIQPSPTSLPTPTSAPEPEEIGWVERIPLPAAGFSFLPPIVLHADLSPVQATLGDIDQTFLMSLAAGPIRPQLSMEEALSEFLANMAADIPDLEAGTPFATKVGGEEGLASDIAGTAFGATFTGRITVVYPSDGPPLFALAFSMDPPIGDGWAAEGEALYVAVLESVEFFSPRSGEASCAVSADPTYGFDQANPVRVGGGAYGGPARERAYLDNLLGPDGQAVSYERTGSIPLEDTVLDGYLLDYSGLGSPVTIYVDEYSFEALYAPAGFTCAGPFPVMPP